MARTPAARYRRPTPVPMTGWEEVQGSVRLEELVLRIPGDEFRIRFHPQLTVLSGIGMLERQALADSIVGALTGRAESTTLTYLDATGRRVRAVSSAGRVVATHDDDGSAAPDLVGTVAADAETLRHLMLVHAGDLGMTPSRSRRDEPPELAEARRMLRELNEQLDRVSASAKAVAAVRAELAEVEAALRRAEEGAARREYAQVLADLDVVRAEAAALQGGTAGADQDRRLLDMAGEVRAVADRWRTVATDLSSLRRRFGARQPMPAGELAVARQWPDRMPADLPTLVADLEAARAERDALADRLKDLAASRLPEPSSPVVAQLARIDQTGLWAAHRRVGETARMLQEAQIGMGGLGPAEGSAMVAEIEAVHQRVDEAERVVEARWRRGVLATGLASVTAVLATTLSPTIALFLLVAALLVSGWFLFLPRHRLTRASAKEAAVLAKVGMPSYLAYQMRRVEAVVDPEARQRLDVAAVEHRTAINAWRDLGDGVTVEAATRLADEIRSYARALSSLGDTADEIEHARRDLTGRAEPAVAAAEAAVREVIAPFGLDDPAAAIETVHERVTVAALAKLQAEMEEAESEEAMLADGLADLLDDAGIVDAPLDERVEAFDWAVQRAEERDAARTRGRSRDAVEDDLMRLQAEARRLRRPEWATVTPSDAAPPELGALARRRDQLRAELDEARAVEAEVELLTDRTGAMERRVAALESQHGTGGHAGLEATIADVQRELLAHLADANHHTTDGERVPVLLDDPFVRIPAERKWELLDMLLRLSDRVQLVYLTDDPYVTAWGRRRSGDGSILLLEPEREPA